MEFNKKAISPVVATALLLVVAVVAVVGFQSWFTTFQSKSFVDIEQKTDTGASITIERLEGNGTDMKLYIRNAGASIVTKPTSITAKECKFDSADLAANSITIINSTSGDSNCELDDNTVANVVIVTDSGVVEGSQMVR